MAVYTEVSDDDLQAFLAEYDIGEAVSFKGIAEGVENSNYLMQTVRAPGDAPQSYILTLYEKRVRRGDLPFFLGLMDHLAGKGISCPTPIHGRDGAALRELCGKPAATTSFLSGMWPRRIAPQHCTGLGAALAAMHLAGADFPMRRPNDLSLDGWKRLAGQTAARAGEVRAGLDGVLTKELALPPARWRSEERRVGKEGVSPCGARGA